MSAPAVCFGSPSPEHDISILTGLQAARALLDRGHDVVGIYWDKRGDFWRVEPDLEAPAFVDGPPKGAQPLRLSAGPGGGFLTEGRLGRSRALELRAVVNCCHGVPGEDGTLQAALDLAGVRYTGPSTAGAALGMDKLAFGAVASAAGLATLPRMPLTDPLTTATFELTPPLIVKPRFGGSSIGIEVVDDLDTALALLRSSPHLRGGAVVEPYRADAIDLNAAVRTFPELVVSAVEKPLRSSDGRIYSYAEKYLHGGEGMASAPPRAAGRHPRRGRRRHRRRRPPPGRGGHGRRRGPHRFPPPRRRGHGQRGQHHPRRPGVVLLVTAGGALRRAAREPDRRGHPHRGTGVPGRRRRRHGAAHGRLDRRQAELSEQTDAELSPWRWLATGAWAGPALGSVVGPVAVVVGGLIEGPGDAEDASVVIAGLAMVAMIMGAVMGLLYGLAFGLVARVVLGTRRAPFDAIPLAMLIPGFVGMLAVQSEERSTGSASAIWVLGFLVLPTIAAGAAAWVFIRREKRSTSG